MKFSTLKTRLLAVVLIFSSLLPLHAGTVYFDNSDKNWSKPYVYYYGSYSDIGWENRKPMEIKSGNIWEYTDIPSGTSTVIFTDGISDGVTQTENLSYNDGHVYTFDSDTGLTYDEYPTDSGGNLTTPVTYTIYFDNTDNWSTVYTWIWDTTDGNKNYTGGEWPGELMTYDSRSKLYSFSFKCYKSTPHFKIIFNGGKDQPQTDNLTYVDGHVFTTSGDSGKTPSEYNSSTDPEDPAGDVYIYVNNAGNWNIPLYAYVYVDGKGDNASWPGEEMTYDPATGYYMYKVPDNFKTGSYAIINDYGEHQYPGAQQTGMTMSGKTKLFNTSTNRWDDYTPPVVEPGKDASYKIYFYNNISWNPINVEFTSNSSGWSKKGSMMSPLNSSMFEIEFTAPENYTLYCRFYSGDNSSEVFTMVNNHVYTLSGDKGDKSTFDESTLLPEAEYWLEPARPTQNDEATLYFNRAYRSNSKLKDTKEIYVWLGANKTDHTGDKWDFGPDSNSWDKIDSRYEMTKVSGQNDIYSITLTPSIAEWLGIDPNSDVRLAQLAFLFRDKAGSQDKQTADYFIDLEVLPDPSLTLGTYKDYQLSGNKLTVNGEDGKLELTFLSEDVVKVFTLRNSMTVREERRSISVVAEGDDKFTLVKPESIDIDETDDCLIVSLNDIERLQIAKENLIITFLDNDGNVSLKESNGLVNRLGNVQVTFQGMGDKAFYGGGYNGNKTDISELGGLTMNNTQTGGWEQGTSAPHNICIPFYVSSKGYGVYFDDHYRNARISPSAQKGSIYSSGSRHPIAYYYIGGGTMEKVMQNYTRLTGLQELPPYWALGYITSRFGYESRAEAEAAVDGIKDVNIPLDGIVFDIQWQGGVSSMGKIDWNTSTFNNPQQMLDNLKARNVNSIAITEPFFTSNSGNYDIMNSNGYFADSNVSGMEWLKSSSVGLIDVTKPEAMNWFKNLYKARTRTSSQWGLDSWWLDLGEPEKHDADSRYSDGSTVDQIHNEYGQIWLAAAYEAMKELDASTGNPIRRILMPRAGTAGMQRYNAFPWTGDIKRSWKGLQAQVPALVNAAMSGVSYMGSDIGGFGQTNGDYNQYTYLRWVQLGVFYPMMRTHADYYNNKWEPEPYSSYYDQVRDEVRKAINLRYAYLPYTYSQSYAYTRYGTPIARPANFNNLDKGYLRNSIDTYYWGPDIYVAPILKSGTSREVTLPDGDWLEMNSYEVYSNSHTYTSSTYDLPYYMRRGSFVTRYAQDSFTSTADIDASRLIVHHFPSYKPGIDSRDGSDYFEDDHQDVNSIANGNYLLTHFEGISDLNAADPYITIFITREGKGWTGMSQTQDITFQIHDYSQVLGDVPDVKLFYYGNSMSARQSAMKAAPTSTTNISEAKSLEALQLGTGSAYFLDSTSSTLYVRLPNLQTSGTYNVGVTRDGSLTEIENLANPASMRLSYANGWLTYSAPEGVEGLAIDIFSATGVTAERFVDLIADGYANQIRVDLPAGVYIARLSGRNAAGDTHEKTVKMIIK